MFGTYSASLIVSIDKCLVVNDLLDGGETAGLVGQIERLRHAEMECPSR